MSLEYNLQFFAEGPGGEKTEAPTEKKKQDARDEGQVAKSKEIESAFALFALFLILKVGVGQIGTSMVGMFMFCYEDIPEYLKNYDSYVNFASLMSLVNRVLIELLLVLAPIFAIAFVVSFACDVAQVRWHPTMKPLAPKGSKLDPLKGFKKIFSKDSIIELVKSLAKLSIIILVAFNYIRKNANGVMLLYDMSLWSAVAAIGTLVINLGLRIAMAYLIIAFSDFAYQRWKHNNDLKMTKQEIKEEYKEQEGDPQIKGKVRQKMREASQRRMMQNLPKADVVITNPTHFAVAIAYDAEHYDAPVVLAKGADYLAQRIKQVAKENDVEIVENKPLARMLYANVEVGEMVPPELYQAVAEVLAFVYHLKGKV